MLPQSPGGLHAIDPALLATLADPYGLAQKMDSLWMDYPLPTPWVGYLSAPQIVVDGVLFDMDWYADVNNLRGSKAMTDYQIPAPTNPFDLSDPTTLKLMSAAVLQQTYSGVTKPGDFLKTYLFTTDDYVSRGFQAGLQTSPVFDWKFYLSSNTDLAAQCGESRGKLYDHFANNGINASRVSSHIFDGKFYRDKYADLNKLFNDNWHDYSKHFITSGIKEGRQASAEFDPKYYRSKYGDLNTLFGDDWRKYYLHYVEYGVSEGRVGSADRAGAPKSR